MSNVVLLSGGMDSSWLARNAAHDCVACVFVDYGQPAAARELEAAESVCSGTGVPLVVVVARSGIELMSMSDPNGKEGPRVVAARNAILCSIAANVAAARGADQVIIGCTADDQELYPDCRPQFLNALSESLFFACGVRVMTPLLGRRKADLLKDCRDAQLALLDSWSCYGPGPDPCGTCNSCRLRMAAADEAGVLDPVMCARERE